MCERASIPNNRFLGVNLNKNAGVFLTESIDHLGNTSPVIICRNDIGSKGPISIFFENLGINKEEINRLTLAHEGAHALHYLADPSMTTNGTPYGAGNPDMASYVGNIIENIAYAHGTLPYFYNLVIGHIGDILGEPIVQQAVQEWIMTNIIMSDDAPLQGIYNSKHIMRQAVIMQEKFGTDIVQYIEKKKKRQIQKVLDLIKQNQQENKSEILKDIVAEENKLKLQLRKLDKRGNYYSKSQQLTQKLNELKQRKKLIMQNKLNIDLSDAAEALAEGYIKQYFFEINKQFLEQNKQVGDITPEELTEHSRWLMDATFGGTGEYRPLTTEILPFTTTKIDKSGGFYPHLQEEANVNKLIKIANKADKLGLLALSKEIDKIILV